MPAERVAALENWRAQVLIGNKKDDPALQLRHDMVRAKVSAFMERPDTVIGASAVDDKPACTLRARDRDYLHGDLRSALARSMA